MTDYLDSKKWQFHRSVIDSEKLVIQGLNIWDHEWKSLDQYISIKDPIYSQNQLMSVYKITDGATSFEFAAGEFSNMVWGIYLPIN